MRISDWSSDVCSSDLPVRRARHHPDRPPRRLSRLVAGGAARGQPRDLSCGECRHQSRRLADRSPSRGPTGPRRREDRGMILLTDQLRKTLRTQSIIRTMTAQREWEETEPCPGAKVLNTIGK